MEIVTSTIKGQIVIPASIGKKFNIVKGTRVRVYEDGERILVEPVNEDPVASGRGMLKTGGKVLQALIADRSKEARPGIQKTGRNSGSSRNCGKRQR